MEQYQTWTYDRLQYLHIQSFFFLKPKNKKAIFSKSTIFPLKIYYLQYQFFCLLFFKRYANSLIDSWIMNFSSSFWSRSLLRCHARVQANANCCIMISWVALSSSSWLICENSLSSSLRVVWLLEGVGGGGGISFKVRKVFFASIFYKIRFLFLQFFLIIFCNFFSWNFITKWK